MSVIEKSVDSQVAHDRMVEIIGEHCKNGKIDMNRANELYDALEAKAKSLGGVETLSQKKAKIETQVREIETAQRIEAAEAKSRHHAELLDEYLAESGENLPSEIGTKEYYDEALSTIDRGLKNGSIEPQKAEVLRTQAKEQLAKLESESNQPVTEKPLTKESLEKDIEALKQGDDISEYLGKLDEAKKQGVINDDEVYELTQKATEKVSEVEIFESENTPDGFPKNPSKPEQLEKKTLEEILGDEKAPKTADEAKKYAEEHEDAEFVVSDDPNNCDMLFLDKEQNNIIYYNKDGTINSYREISPSKGVNLRDTNLDSDGTVESVETSATNGDLKIEYYEKGNLTQKELYSNENEDSTAHLVYFDSEGNMTGARKAVQNKETGTWEYTPKYEYNTKDNVFELKNEKGEVESTIKYDEATEHWAEFDAEGKVVHEIKKSGIVIQPELESEPTPVGENSENNPASEKVEKRNSDGTKIPKKFRGRDDVTYDHKTKTYTERTEKDGVTTESIYDSKGRLLQEVEGNQTKYYNSKGEVIAEQEITDHGIKRTEKSKDYDLDVLFNSLGEGEKITIKYHEDKKGNAAEPEEFIYNKDKNVYENKGPEGTVFKTVEYDAKNHKWTIKDAEGKKIDSQNNMKESHIKRNIGIGAGVLALGALAYGIATSGDDKKVKKVDKQEQVNPTPKNITPAPKAETKVTLDGKEGTIAEDGTLTLDGKPYPKDTDGTYTIGDKKYKVEDGKLVEVVDTPDDNGETGGAAPDESPEVKGTIDGKEYTIKDGTVTIDGDQFDPHSDGFYYIGNAKYTIGADGKLVKADETTQSGSAGSATQTGSDSAQSGSAGSATQTGSDSAQAGNTGATSQQTGNTNTTNTHVTAPAQPADSSASTRTTGTTHNDTSVTTRHTNVPAEESRVNSSRPSEQSAESRHTGNTPVTGVTEPTDEQKQVAKTLQDEISSIANAENALGFIQKIDIAVRKGQITPQQAEDLLAKVQTYVKTFDNVSQGLDEQNHSPEPEFGLGEVTTPQEPQRKEKQEITPMERMELTEKIRKATDRKDIEEIQQEMRQYKVFPGRKNLRRAYKAKLRAIKHQDEPQKVGKYNKKFEKRMEKIEDSKVYKNDKDQINRENFQKMKYIDDTIKRPKIFDDGIFNA